MSLKAKKGGWGLERRTVEEQEGCHVHAVTHVLTFNVSHFVGLAGRGPGIAVVDPATV